MPAAAGWRARHRRLAGALLLAACDPPFPATLTPRRRCDGLRRPASCPVFVPRDGPPPCTLGTAVREAPESQHQHVPGVRGQASWSGCAGSLTEKRGTAKRDPAKPPSASSPPLLPARLVPAAPRRGLGTCRQLSLPTPSMDDSPLRPQPQRTPISRARLFSSAPSLAVSYDGRHGSCPCILAPSSGDVAHLLPQTAVSYGSLVGGLRRRLSCPVSGPFRGAAVPSASICARLTCSLPPPGGRFSSSPYNPATELQIPPRDSRKFPLPVVCLVLSLSPPPCGHLHECLGLPTPSFPCPYRFLAWVVPVSSLCVGFSPSPASPARRRRRRRHGRRPGGGVRVRVRGEDGAVLAVPSMRPAAEHARPGEFRRERGAGRPPGRAGGASRQGHPPIGPPLEEPAPSAPATTTTASGWPSTPRSPRRTTSSSRRSSP